MGSQSAATAAFGGVLPPGITGTNDRCTLLASNLAPEEVDADKLFNLFSNYGNITRIKILHNKPDHALIQMGDGFQAELAFNYLKVCKSIISAHTVMKILSVMVSLPMVHTRRLFQSVSLLLLFLTKIIVHVLMC
jgi:hypothetical protein